MGFWGVATNILLTELSNSSSRSEWMSEWWCASVCVCVYVSAAKVCELSVCEYILTGCACELVSSQGHLVIPQAYQGQRTHKYQRQMPQKQQQQQQLHPCPFSFFALSLSLFLSVCICMYGIFNFIIEPGCHFPFFLQGFLDTEKNVVYKCH